MIYYHDDVNCWPYIWVVFCNCENIWWLRWLKKGFRHCFIVMGDGENWLSIEATLTRTYIKRTNDSAYLERLKAQNLTLIRSKIYKNTPSSDLNFGFFSCVELTKSILGIRQISLQTPYSLYKFLISYDKK